MTSAPDTKTLRIEIDGDVGVLTLDRPDAFNAMSPEMMEEMGLAFAWLADRAPLRALVLTGAGRAFCAGGDIGLFRQGFEEGRDLSVEIRRNAGDLHAAILHLRRIPYPVLAAVNGAAAGAGMSLALACDLRIASEKASFLTAYARIGVSPDGGMTHALPRIVGPARALELLLEDARIDAARALEEGIVSEVVAPERLLDAARAKAAELARLAPHYARTAKALVAQSFANELPGQLELERDAIAAAMAMDDAANGIRAFFAGEDVEFKGT